MKVNLINENFTSDYLQGSPVSRPVNLERMLEIATVLSEGFPEVRVDLYNCNGKIYFGEMTFFHWSGFVPFEPVEWDYKFGEYLQLPKV